ncbi:MAG: transglycosylase SLT domain-containing protein [Treponema sp.]|jgi:hypothetical protein|nr:transglycosylase SLT domain-containing protein [Treponema sp.]
MRVVISRFDQIYPYCCAVVISAFLAVFAAAPRFPLPVSHPVPEAETGISGIDAETAPEPAEAAFEKPVQISLAQAAFRGEQDRILEFYRDSETRDQVVSFFGSLVHSQELASVVLSNANTFNISPSLAFALCWEESQFKPHAVNRKNRNETIDRGLFQLNSKSFPHLTEREFLDPRINSYYGLSHLRWCLDSGGSLVAGLAMYNAGTNRVATGGTPKRTLDYVSSILDSKQHLEDLFEAHGMNVVLASLSVIQSSRPEETGAPKDLSPERPRLNLLAPAARGTR